MKLILDHKKLFNELMNWGFSIVIKILLQNNLLKNTIIKKQNIIF